jgi:excisionase family DNA binding protein
VPEQLVEAVAGRAAQLVLDGLERPSPWLTVEQAAEHLACPTSRVYALVSARRIPHERDGSRPLFDRRELDAWVRSGGGKRP